MNLIWHNTASWLGITFIICLSFSVFFSILPIKAKQCWQYWQSQYWCYVGTEHRIYNCIIIIILLKLNFILTVVAIYNSRNTTGNHVPTYSVSLPLLMDFDWTFTCIDEIAWNLFYLWVVFANFKTGQLLMRRKLSWIILILPYTWLIIQRQ